MTRPTLAWTLWAMAWAAVAAWAAVRPNGLARLRAPQADRWPSWLPEFLRPRPDALAAPVRWLVGAFTGVSVTFGLWGTGPLGFVLGGASVPIAAVFLGRLERGAGRTADQALRLQTPSALDSLVACLEAGLPLRQATAVVAGLSPPEVGQQLRRVANGVEVGLSDAEAWLGLKDHAVLGPVARDVARAADWGTTIATLLTGYARQFRLDIESEATTRARAVGVRTVLPLSLCYLPAFILLGLVPMVAAGMLSLLGR